MFLGSARVSAKAGSGPTSMLPFKFWPVRAPFLTGTGSPVVPADDGVGKRRVEALPLCEKTDAEAAPIHLSEEQHL